VVFVGLSLVRWGSPVRSQSSLFRCSIAGTGRSTFSLTEAPLAPLAHQVRFRAQRRNAIRKQSRWAMLSAPVRLPQGGVEPW